MLASAVAGSRYFYEVPAGAEVSKSTPSLIAPISCPLSLSPCGNHIFHRGKASLINKGNKQATPNRGQEFLSCCVSEDRTTPPEYLMLWGESTQIVSGREGAIRIYSNAAALNFFSTEYIKEKARQGFHARNKAPKIKGHPHSNSDRGCLLKKEKVLLISREKGVQPCSHSFYIGSATFDKVFIHRQYSLSSNSQEISARAEGCNALQYNSTPIVLFYFNFLPELWGCGPTAV